MNFILIYLFLMNALAFAIMLLDKRKAVQHHRRIPERYLFGTAILGGSIGTYLAMELFHHKTKHKKFSKGVPIMIAIHLLIVIVLAFLESREIAAAIASQFPTIE